MTYRLALREVKLIESLTMFECILIDRMKDRRSDLYNNIKDNSNIKEIKQIIIDYVIWEET